jgi:hypothetical protein
MFSGLTPCKFAAANRATLFPKSFAREKAIAGQHLLYVTEVKITQLVADQRGDL